MVVDFLVNGKHATGYEFYAPIRIWAPRGTDFEGQLRQIFDMNGEIESWSIEQRRIRPILSLLYTGEGHSELRFVFYGESSE